MASFTVVHSTAARGLPSLSRRAPLSVDARHAQVQAQVPFARRSSNGSAVKLVMASASRSSTRVGFAADSSALISGASRAARGAGAVPRATVIKASNDFDASDSNGSENDDESLTVKSVEAPAPGDERAKTLLLGALFAGW
jgi:hypothetical protein